MMLYCDWTIKIMQAKISNPVLVGNVRWFGACFVDDQNRTVLLQLDLGLAVCKLIGARRVLGQNAAGGDSGAVDQPQLFPIFPDLIW